ncbi:MAG TPA: Ig-like domain-containing protein [Gemmatimonadales bacterium]|nr:Ig-like domain-containing protein [Gemmatimonadales bacterium]
MAATILFFSRRSLVVLLAGALGCASGELLLPDPPGGGENVQLAKFDGDLQQGTVGEQLPEPLVVQVLTPRQQPATGRRVAFVITSSAGEVTPDTAITDSQGLATARAVLGTAPGDYVIEARLVAETPQIEAFTAKAGPAAPDTLGPQSPLSQPGRRNQVVSSAPLVRVVDRFGNAVPNVPVAWQVTAGEGQTAEPITRTGVDGTATVQWTLGGRIGVHKLVATIEQASTSAVTFTATVLF